MIKDEFNKEYQVYYNDVDQRKRLYPDKLLEYFADSNLNHVKQKNLSIEDILDRGYTYMIQKYQVDFKKPIYLDEKITIAAGLSAVTSSNLHRSAVAYDSEGKLVATSRGLVFIVDTKSRKSVPIPDFVYSSLNISSPMEKPFPFERIGEVSNTDYIKEVPVLYRDLDLNNHVTNSKYINWALESLPRNFILENFLNRTRILYMREVFYGDVLTLKSQIIEKGNGEKTTLHEIINSTGTITTRIECTWQGDRHMSYELLDN